MSRAAALSKLGEFSEGIESSVPSYEELDQEVSPRFIELISKLEREGQEVLSGDKQKIIVLGTGGTFQSNKTDNGIEPDGGSLKDSFDALSIPMPNGVKLELFDVMNADSSQLGVEQWRFIADKIIELERKVSGFYTSVIVTHGTDTMAEAGSYLSYMLQGTPKPIVVTGSQVPARMENTDAGQQMERAIKSATIAARERVNEVLIACGLGTIRGSWAIKAGDVTPNTFVPFGILALQGSTVITPPHIDFSSASIPALNPAFKGGQKQPFRPFTDFTESANIAPLKLEGWDMNDFIRQLDANHFPVLQALGSATADDRLVKLAIEATKEGVIAPVGLSPFVDASTDTSKYAAGAELGKVVEKVQSVVPILALSVPSLEAKVNMAKHQAGLNGLTGSDKLLEPEQVRQFWDYMESNVVGEFPLGNN